MSSTPRASAPSLRPSASRYRDRHHSTSGGARSALVFLRAIVWGLIGLIYAPLFIGTLSLFEHSGAGVWSFVAAAAVTGGAGAVLYGGRETALIGTGVGLAVGALLLFGAGDGVPFAAVPLPAVLTAAAIGLSPLFPASCARHVPGKALAGILAGTFGGGVLAVAEPLHPDPFSIFAVLAFLVSVNGILYVASVRRVVDLTRRLRIQARPCNLIEVLVLSLLAGLAAGSVWVMAAPFLGEPGNLVREVGDAVYAQLPAALLGGIFGGALAGALLQAFRFSWVHDI